MSHHHTLLADLRQSGRRLTKQRDLILDVICKSEKHLNADEILRRVRRTHPHLHKSVVYRNLAMLTRLGLINATDLGEGRAEYELHRHPHHHHLLCRDCGNRTEIEERFFVSLARTLREHYRFAADLDHIAIRGLCRKCNNLSNPAHHAVALSTRKTRR